MSKEKVKKELEEWKENFDRGLVEKLRGFAPCYRDIKGRHYWEIVGFCEGYLIRRCSQCGLCYKETVQYISGSE